MSHAEEEEELAQACFGRPLITCPVCCPSHWASGFQHRSCRETQTFRHAGAKFLDKKREERLPGQKERYSTVFATLVTKSKAARLFSNRIRTG